MKHFVKKKDEPKVFSDWKALANEDWQPTYEALSGLEKQVVKAGLMQEQGGLCCYCESKLTDNDSHIEHFRPQCDPAVDPLDYANMLCSCQQRLEKGDPRHCGNLKDDWFDEVLLVSPLVVGCETRFAYTGDGEINPADPGDEAAKQTIAKLGLNIEKLKGMRESAIEPFLDDSLGDKEFRRFVKRYLRPDKTGTFNEFWTTINFLFVAHPA